MQIYIYQNSKMLVYKIGHFSSLYQKIISYFFHFKKTQVYIQKKEWINLLEIFIFRLFWDVIYSEYLVMQGPEVDVVCVEVEDLEIVVAGVVQASIFKSWYKSLNNKYGKSKAA